MEGDGRVVRYEGNWSMYQRLRPARAAPELSSLPRPPAAPSTGSTTGTSAGPTEEPKKQRLSYKHQRELDGMEASIEAAEANKAALEARLATPEVFTNAADVTRLSAELDSATHEVERLYRRWQELTALAG